MAKQEFTITITHKVKDSITPEQAARWRYGVNLIWQLFEEYERSPEGQAAMAAIIAADAAAAAGAENASAAGGSDSTGATNGVGNSVSGLG